MSSPVERCVGNVRGRGPRSLSLGFRYVGSLPALGFASRAGNDKSVYRNISHRHGAHYSARICQRAGSAPVAFPLS
jgi:hypothetical protein